MWTYTENLSRGHRAINFIYLTEHLEGNFRSSSEVHLKPILRWSCRAGRTAQRTERVKKMYRDALICVLLVPLRTMQPAHGQTSGRALQPDGRAEFAMPDAVAADWVWHFYHG